MTVYKDLPEWPFFPDNKPLKDTKPYKDIILNQALSIHLDDDELRKKLLKEFGMHKKALVQRFPSAYHPDDMQRSRPYSYVPKGQHRRNTWLVAGYEEVREVLANPEIFSNVPYADLGDRSFLLALDPTAILGNPEAGRPYKRQRDYLSELIQKPTGEQLSKLSNEAVRHAMVAGLTHNRFDLAAFAEQAAVRFCGLWFGFASTDYGVIQNTATASYRALVHLIVGRHFGSEPTVIPKAETAMAQLTIRASELITEYRKISWQPREVHGKLKHRENRAHWPEGVTPLDEWGLGDIGKPLLQKMALENSDFTVAELASMATGLIAGTVGNVQASVCTVIQQIFAEQEDYLQQNRAATSGPLHVAIDEAHACPEKVHMGLLHKRIGQLLLKYPPVAYLPRRAVKDGTLDGKDIKEGDDIILWLTAASYLKKPIYKDGYHGLPFGATDAEITSETSGPPHSCLGTTPAHALVTTIVGSVLRLPSIAEVINSVTGKPEGLKRRWGFSCQEYPLTHKRALRVAQQPLNLIMRVKTPTDKHSSALQRIIYAGAPSVEKVLKDSGHVHFAWFQLLDQGRYLALHTVYDGNFDAYIQDFALKVDDLFDQILEHVEGAPPLPVAENPGAFVDVIRGNNARSVNGYFFSASPTTEVSDIARKFPGNS